jgi:excisionase family DNA binding protein
MPKTKFDVPDCLSWGCSRSGLWDGYCIWHRREIIWKKCSVDGCEINTLHKSGKCRFCRSDTVPETVDKLRSLPDKALYTSGDMAELFGVSTRTVRRWVQDGLVRPRTTPGGHLRFTKAQLRRLSNRFDRKR